MKQIRDLIAEHPFFENFSDAYIDTIASCGKNVAFNPHEYMAREGVSADTFYLIRRGIVRVEIFLPAKGKQVIQTLSEGDIAGWSWIFPPYQWTFDLQAMNEVSAIALDGRCLRGKCEVDHSLGYQLMKTFAQIMVDRLKASRIQCLDIYGNSNHGT